MLVQTASGLLSSGNQLVDVQTSYDPYPVIGRHQAPAGLISAVNANFDDSQDWQDTGGWYVQDGYLLCQVGNGNFLYRNVPVVRGQRYRLSVYVSEYTRGTIRAVFNYHALDVTFSGAGLYTVDFTANESNDTFNLQANDALDVKIDDVQMTLL